METILHKTHRKWKSAEYVECVLLRIRSEEQEKKIFFYRFIAY